VFAANAGIVNGAKFAGRGRNHEPLGYGCADRLPGVPGGDDLTGSAEGDRVKYSIVIQEPFYRVLWYEHDTKEEARQFVGTLAAILDMELVCDIVPSEFLRATQYDA
jgi:hypothetical protein